MQDGSYIDSCLITIDSQCADDRTAPSTVILTFQSYNQEYKVSTISKKDHQSIRKHFYIKIYNLHKIQLKTYLKKCI